MIKPQSISQVVLDENRVFEETARRFQRGEMPPVEFQKFRLQHGIYGIRGSDRHMIRIKVPGGLITSGQLRRVAELTRDYAGDIAHISTRQNFQLHRVKLDDVILAMPRLAEVGLTTREACGNTVRNITACHRAGVCRDEAFDVTPYAQVLFRFFLRNPISQNLPRKFKISFSGCSDKPCGLPAIHDIGWVAQVRSIEGKSVKGFRMLVGGGMGTWDVNAKLLSDFVPVKDMFRYAEAVVRVFDRAGDQERKVRSAARLKFLIRRIGWEAFVQEFQKELAGIVERGETPDLEELPEEAGESGGGPEQAAFSLPSNGNPSFERFKKFSVEPQKQAGFHLVHVTPVIGDMTSAQMEGLADLADRYSDGELRTTNTQNIVLRWVKTESLKPLFEALVALKLDYFSGEGIYNVITCPGADTCQIAITKSKGLGRELVETLRRAQDNFADAEDISVKVSGCPNSCSQTRIASIGFQGAAKRAGDKEIPHYTLYVGGDGLGGESTFSRLIDKVPARRAPQTLLRLIQFYREKREKGESFNVFIRRMDVAQIKEAIAPLIALDADPSKLDPELFKDWSDEIPFKTSVGKGECAV